jgi:hypothetical protein
MRRLTRKRFIGSSEKPAQTPLSGRAP